MKFTDFIESLDQNSIEGSNNLLHETKNLVIDQRTTCLNQETFKKFYDFGTELSIFDKFAELTEGVKANTTENRAVTHFQYRDKSSKLYEQSLTAISKLAEHLSSFEKIIFFGIGGSYLGPKLMNDIFTGGKQEIIFITGSDPEEYKFLVEKDHTNTAFIIASKSFSTIETLESYQSVTDGKNLKQTFAITANVSSAIEYGIDENQIFEFDKGVGGRFSIWSPINIVLFLKLGIQGFESFLKAGNEIDNSYKNELASNPALSLAIQDLLMINLLDMQTSLILNYDYKLRNFASYVQQLDMESLGKTVDIEGNTIKDHQTGSIVWGGYAPRSQHSFFQHLYQGSTPANTYIIGSKSKNLNAKQMTGQIKSLKEGNFNEKDPHKLVNIRKFTSISFDEISPETLGELIAIWENKTIFKSMFWNINPFDQWGVELGKINTLKEIE